MRMLPYKQKCLILYLENWVINIHGNATAEIQGYLGICVSTLVKKKTSQLLESESQELDRAQELDRGKRGQPTTCKHNTHICIENSENTRNILEQFVHNIHYKN